MSGVIVDTNCWPVVWIRFGSGADEHDFKRALDQLAVVVARPTPHLLVFDVRESKLTRPAHVAMQVSWARNNLKQLRSHVMGVCFVIDSPLVQFTLSSVVAMVRMPQTMGVVATPAEAARWSTASLAKHGFGSPDLTRMTG